MFSLFPHDKNNKKNNEGELIKLIGNVSEVKPLKKQENWTHL